MRGIPTEHLSIDGTTSDRRARVAYHLIVPVLVVLLVASASGRPSVQVDPAFFHLGSFSTIDPIDSDIVSGMAEIRVQSVDPWQLEVQLVGPATRITDGLELPLSRLGETHPDIPQEVANLQPYIYRSGDGGSTPVAISGGLIELATNLQSYLHEGDPPGTYEATLLLRLLDEQGSPVTDHVSATMQFDVKPWIYFASEPSGGCELTIPPGETFGESDIMVFTVASNTSWELSASCSGDLYSEDGDVTLPLYELSVCTEGMGTVGWRPRRSECEAAQPYPVAIATGDAPDPFTVGYSDVPVYLRYESSEELPAGRYGTDLTLHVEVDEFAR